MGARFADMALKVEEKKREKEDRERRRRAEQERSTTTRSSSTTTGREGMPITGPLFNQVAVAEDLMRLRVMMIQELSRLKLELPGCMQPVQRETYYSFRRHYGVREGEDVWDPLVTTLLEPEGKRRRGGE